MKYALLVASPSSLLINFLREFRIVSTKLFIFNTEKYMESDVACVLFCNIYNDTILLYLIATF